MVWGPTVVVVLLTANVCRRTVSLGERLAEVVVAESAKKLTVPVAKGGVATESVTVAVQLVEAPALKVGGLQLTVVTVGCLVTVTAAAEIGRASCRVGWGSSGVAVGGGDKGGGVRLAAI